MEMCCHLDNIGNDTEVRDSHSLCVKTELDNTIAVYVNFTFGFPVDMIRSTISTRKAVAGLTCCPARKRKERKGCLGLAGFKSYSLIIFRLT